MSARVFFISVGLLLILAAEYAYTEEKQQYYGIEDGNEPIVISLTDHNGKPVDLSRLKNKITLITFGYTNCPDICPMTLSILKHVINQLGGWREDIQVFFVTIDPENDTPEKLKSYITFFHPEFLGLTGSKEDIVNVAQSFKSHYPDVNQDEDTNHLKRHTFSIYLVNKEGRLFLTYPPDRLNPREISRDIDKVAQ